MNREEVKVEKMVIIAEATGMEPHQVDLLSSGTSSP